EFSVLRRIGIGLAIVGGVINCMLYNVDDGHRDVIFDRFQGVKLDVIEEGTHFMISWLHRPIIFDIHTRPRSAPSITEIKDLQTINITLRILYRPRAELLPKISCKLGELLIERAAQFGLLLDDISITHLSFRPEFTNAVELKQVAQQDVEKQRFLVEKTEQSRQANVIAEEGDGRTADLIGKALDEVGDAAEGTANQLSKSRNIVYLPHGPQMLLNITGEKEDQTNNSLDDIKDLSTIEMMNFDNLFRCFILIQSFVRGWRNPFHLQEIFTYRREKIGKQKGNQNYINARFRSPLVNYLPHLVIATAHFQLVLSRDQGFSRRRLFTAVPLINQYPIGSILLENPYYGLRKPPDLLHWYQKMKLTSAILHDFSLGGHMASLAFTK
ncbi:unnamed protein product, partial [Rotaria sordida]